MTVLSPWILCRNIVDVHWKNPKLPYSESKIRQGKLIFRSVFISDVELQYIDSFTIMLTDTNTCTITRDNAIPLRTRLRIYVSPLTKRCSGAVANLHEHWSLQGRLLPLFKLSRYRGGLRAGRLGFDSQQCKIFLSSTASKPTLGSTHPPIQWVPVDLFPEVMQQRREADHVPPSCAETKNCWAIHPLPHILHGIKLNLCIGTTSP
jgi:hypothetical protein